MKKMKNYAPVLTVMMIAVLLQGCAAIVVAGAATMVTSVHDRRALGAQVEDEEIELKVNGLIADNKQLKHAVNVAVISYNRRVLLVGQAPSAHLSNEVEKLVYSYQGIRKVYNEIRIQKPVGAAEHTDDTWITSKVKTNLLAAEKIDGSHIKVYTENNEVFLMGIVSDYEAKVAIDTVRKLNGVKGVIDVFERQ